VSGAQPVLIELQLDDNVAGIKLVLAVAAFSVANLSAALGGDEDPPNRVFHALDLDLALKRFLHAVFFIARDSKDEELHGGDHLCASVRAAAARDCVIRRVSPSGCPGNRRNSRRTGRSRTAAA